MPEKAPIINLTETCFDKQWNLWTGLFPVGSRRKSAYFYVLRHHTDTAFEAASGAYISSGTKFPSTGEINGHVPRSGSYRASKSPDWSPFDEMTQEQLAAEFEKTRKLYRFLPFPVSIGPPRISRMFFHPDQLMHYALRRLRRENGEGCAAEWHNRKKEGNAEASPF